MVQNSHSCDTKCNVCGTTRSITHKYTTSTTISSLKAKTTYYVRVRTYKTVSGVKYYSGWSTYKYEKTK